MQYRNSTNLSSLIRANIHRIPRVDAVVGIPRSGMLPATLIATLTDQPLLCVSELFKSSFPLKPKHGGRWENMDWPGTILLVDDSISGGQTFARIDQQIRLKHPQAFITKLAVFRKPQSPDICISFETVPGPRVFEWNWFRHPLIKKAVFDIDGVICTETEKVKDWTDLAAVRAIRERAEPLWIPKYEVLALATGRRECEREWTEAWLAKHGVRYGKLYMTDGVYNTEERYIPGKARVTKSIAVLETQATWMVESNAKQAEHIRVTAGKPVLCTDTNTMFS